MCVCVCVCVCVCMYRNLEAYVAPLFVLIINTGDVIVMSLFLFPIHTYTPRKWFFPHNMMSSIER